LKTLGTVMSRMGIDTSVWRHLQGCAELLQNISRWPHYNIWLLGDNEITCRWLIRKATTYPTVPNLTYICYRNKNYNR
jgi:hypothetical protein